MKIKDIRIINYKCIDDITVDFSTTYSALSGKNNAGKTNVIKAIRSFFKEEEFYSGYENEITHKDDFPFWKKAELEKGHIEFHLKLELSPNRDEGLITFIEKISEIRIDQGNLELLIKSKYFSEKSKNESAVFVKGKDTGTYNSKEILQKLKSSNLLFFHNSTDRTDGYSLKYKHSRFLKDLTGEGKKSLEDLNKRIKNKIGKITKKQAEEITTILGMLEEKYSVALSAPDIDIDYIPFEISLSDRSVDVPLNLWGSGTKNKTYILLSLLKARQIADSTGNPSKITPIVIVEEPESFLHPSAQSEFGKALQEIAQTFDIQVIVTTHSPYMLSQKDPKSNVLLHRKKNRGKHQETAIFNIDSENWMEPFSLALGIDNKEFQPWKNVLFNSSDRILLVEGDIDKEYLEYLKDEKHGKNRLSFEGEIFPYNGWTTLENNVLLKFVKNKYKKMLVTFDLDALSKLGRCLSGLKLEKNLDYIAIGIDKPGKKSIEGLLPESVVKKVNTDNVDLVMKAMNGETEERRSAKNNLKRLYLNHVKSLDEIPKDEMKDFYSVVKHINGIMATK